MRSWMHRVVYALERKRFVKISRSTMGLWESKRRDCGGGPLLYAYSATDVGIITTTRSWMHRVVYALERKRLLKISCSTMGLWESHRRDCGGGSLLYTHSVTDVDIITTTIMRSWMHRVVYALERKCFVKISRPTTGLWESKRRDCGGGPLLYAHSVTDSGIIANRSCVRGSTPMFTRSRP